LGYKEDGTDLSPVCCVVALSAITVVDRQ